MNASGGVRGGEIVGVRGVGGGDDDGCGLGGGDEDVNVVVFAVEVPARCGPHSSSRSLSSS